MKNKNKLITLLMLSTSTAIGSIILNNLIKLSATSKNILEDNHSHCFHWRLGNIHYTKVGTGKPLLLVHDLDSCSSGYEWHRMIDLLKDQFTIYTIDLLGCGRSEKPDLTYTNFLYVQLISDFIKSEIGHRTNVISTNKTSSIAIMACNYSPELFDKLMFVNPESILSSSQLPTKYAKYLKTFLDLPIIGTLLYNISNSKKAIRDNLVNNVFYNPYSVKASFIDAYYESAHLGDSAKSTYASIKCNYTKCNISSSLKNIDNSIFLVGGGNKDQIKTIINEYIMTNSAIEYSIIPRTKLLPQLESPNELTNIIKMFFI